MNQDKKVLIETIVMVGILGVILWWGIYASAENDISKKHCDEYSKDNVVDEDIKEFCKRFGYFK